MDTEPGNLHPHAVLADNNRWLENPAPISLYETSSYSTSENRKPASWTAFDRPSKPSRGFRSTQARHEAKREGTRALSISDIWPLDVRAQL